VRLVSFIYVTWLIRQAASEKALELRVTLLFLCVTWLICVIWINRQAAAEKALEMLEPEELAAAAAAPVVAPGVLDHVCMYRFVWSGYVYICRFMCWYNMGACVICVYLYGSAWIGCCHRRCSEQRRRQQASRLIDMNTQILYILTAPRKKKISCGIQNRIRCQSQCKWSYITHTRILRHTHIVSLMCTQHPSRTNLTRLWQQQCISIRM